MKRAASPALPRSVYFLLLAVLAANIIVTYVMINYFL